ncbi:MAG: hypothetical protein ACQKBV_08110 [Puniceicoccales bacterium]
MILRFLFILLCIAKLSATTVEEARASLGGEQALIIQGRSPVTGHAVKIDGEEIVFRSARGGGSLEYRFPLEKVERLQFPGGELVTEINALFDASETQTALVLMQMLYEQRAPFLPVVTPTELEYFARYAEMQHRHGDPYKAVGTGRAITPHIDDSTLRRKVSDLVLLGHYQLPLKSETRKLAEEWIANQERYGPSALGYYVIAQMEFDEERYDAALWQSLEPVVFSSQFPMDYLDYCYALAIAASVELKLADEEAKLRAEMDLRGFAWPDIAQLAAYEHPLPVDSLPRESISNH